MSEQQYSIAGRGPGQSLSLQDNKLDTFQKRQAAKVNPPDETNSSTIEYIKKLTAGNFYGNLSLTFTAGKVTLIKKEQTIKP